MKNTGNLKRSAGLSLSFDRTLINKLLSIIEKFARETSKGKVMRPNGILYD